MCINAGVSRRSGQVLIFAVRDVLVCFGITIFLGEAEVYDVNQISFFAKAH